MERVHAAHTQQLSEGDHATWFTVNFDDKEMKEMCERVKSSVRWNSSALKK